MSKHVQNALLAELSEFLSSHMGLHFPKERRLDLLRGIRSAAKDFGFDDVETCIRWLLSSPLKKHQIEILAGHLTVGETYFFREAKMFEALEKQILPALINAREKTSKRLRIWSAGCCTGEEPYSIAILLSKLIPDLSNWNILILATDINPIFLQKAEEGIYGEWSFRGTPLWLREQYFRRTKDNRYEILPRIKRMVKFSYLNLVEDVYPAFLNDTNAMDIIFCRNVLMYFTTDQMKKVVQRFHQTLVEDGWLVVGSSESSNAYFPQYRAVNFPGAILYKKREKNIEKNKRPIIEFIPQEIPRPLSEDKVSSTEQIFSNFEFSPEFTDNTFPETVESPGVNPKQDTKTETNLYKEALELYDKGHYSETEEKITLHLSERNNDPKAMILLAKTFANQGKLSKALEWCEKAIAIDKLKPEFYHLYAAILQEQGQTDRAMEALKRALYLDPNFALAHFMLGNLTRQRKKIKESNKYLENAHSLLNIHKKDEILPEAEGMTAGRLMELIQIMRNEGRPA